jgi:hypothetical protein
VRATVDLTLRVREAETSRELTDSRLGVVQGKGIGRDGDGGRDADIQSQIERTGLAAEEPSSVQKYFQFSYFAGLKHLRGRPTDWGASVSVE